MLNIRGVLHPLVQAGRRFVEWAGAIYPGTPSARKFSNFGTGSLIAFPQATIFGQEAIHIGEETLIGRHVTLSVGYMPGAPTLPTSGLIIGDRCVIGARCTLTAHGTIEIGDDVWLGQAVFISDSGHGYQDPNLPIGKQMSPHEPISIGSGSWVGHGAMILPGSRIGKQVVVGAGAVVRGEIPDHCVVAGVPARIVRRLEPGVGWVGVKGDVRPVIDFERMVTTWVGQGGS